MKLRIYLLKRFVILLKLLLLWMTMDGQIYTWGDLTSTSCNHTIAAVIEGKANDLIILGKASDKNFGDLKINYCRITTSGQVLSDKIFAGNTNLFDINSILYQPDGLLRVYGTSIFSNGIMAPYINTINPVNNSISDNIITAQEYEIFGNAKKISKNELILVKTIKNSTSGITNICASRINMKAKDLEKNSVVIGSKFNEEVKTLFVLQDTSFVVIGRRDLDQNRSKSIGMIYYISPDFKIKWNMQVLNSAGLTNQNMTCGKEGWIYYFSSIKNNDNSSCSSKGFIFEKDGNKIRQFDVDSFYVNSVLTLKNGNILVAGYKLQKYGSNTIEKAHYIVYDKTLKKIKSRTLGKVDKPDSDLPVAGISTLPTSSEYTCAVQLANGKIVLGGSALVPVFISPDKISGSDRANKYLLVILTNNGDLL